MLDEGRDKVDFVIDDKDLPPPLPEIVITDQDLSIAELNVLVVSAADIARIEEQFVRISEKDLPPILYIRAKDLPPILRIQMEELPADLNFLTTECYHGTSRHAAEQIKAHGFQVGGGTGYGAGIYFSVGGMSIARGYVKGEPCIVRARVDWGRVAYLDDQKLPARVRGGGEAATRAALEAGYHSIISAHKFSTASPAVGVVLGLIGSHVRPPRIQVVELIDPRRLRS